MIRLLLFLPVYNRGKLTGDFLRHFNLLTSGLLSVNVILLDDGCTDNTIGIARQAWPSLSVVHLDGSAYWGGAINAIIHLINKDSSECSIDTVYMLANDDIRFPSREAFFAGFNAVRPSTLVCARGIMVPNIEHCSASISSSSYTPAVYYDARTGTFSEAAHINASNVASTWSMLAPKEVWLSARLVPPTIPHYLSDYWLTYNLVLKGYTLLQPLGFICNVCSTTTQNQPGKKIHKVSTPGQSFDGLSRILSKQSPQYAPAWIQFWNQTRPAPLKLKYRIVDLTTRYYLAIFAQRLFNKIASYLARYSRCEPKP